MGRGRPGLGPGPPPSKSPEEGVTDGTWGKVGVIPLKAHQESVIRRGKDEPCRMLLTLSKRRSREPTHLLERRSLVTLTETVWGSGGMRKGSEQGRTQAETAP